MSGVDRKIPGIEFFDINNELISFSNIKNKTLLILFFDPLNTYHKERLIYAQVLRNKYDSNRIEVIGVCSSNKDACRELFVTGRFSFRFAFDKGEGIQRAFGINECCGGTVLADRDKIIKFQSSLLLNSENLRQLVEKELTGRIVYDFPALKRISIQAIEQRLKNMAFLDLNSGKIRHMSSFSSADSDYIVLTFFSGFCPSCRSGMRIATLKRLENAYTLNRIEAKSILVFPRPFNERDISEWEKFVPMPFDKYISFEDIFSDEEKYITDMAKKVDPLTLVLDQGADIIYAERLGLSENDLHDEIMNLFPKTKEPG